ncbi:hypothetical protein Ddye_017450 [Dipteronia dyeriana]|uniref:Uncharacterized protein n=1 Tax=Dipteronia dyeriana TaxID=168575 RepID=A0AAD9U8N1_9ROSI|nr:hypothetical protein Ddye_017450 [Dipteronia dyeriana]
MTDVPMPSMLRVPHDMCAGMAMRDATVRQPMPSMALPTALANASPEQHMPIMALPTALANASSEQQMTVLLGESLNPQVEQLEQDAAAKVHHNATKFRKEGIDPIMMEKLDRMFMMIMLGLPHLVCFHQIVLIPTPFK